MGKLSVDKVCVLAARAHIPVHLVLSQDKYDNKSYQYIINFKQMSGETLVLKLIMAGAIPPEYSGCEPNSVKADLSQLPLLHNSHTYTPRHVLPLQDDPAHEGDGVTLRTRYDLKDYPTGVEVTASLDDKVADKTVLPQVDENWKAGHSLLSFVSVIHASSF